MGANKSVIGKWIGQTVYVHTDVSLWLPSKHKNMLARALRITNSVSCSPYNVLKINPPMDCVSLLEYRAFRTDPFPSLVSALTINLESGSSKERSYAKSSNPPILHRKELLLGPNDPDRERFGKLTERLESLGMYKKAERIGFRKQWIQRLIVAGLCIKEHRVIECTIQTGSADDEPW